MDVAQLVFPQEALEIQLSLDFVKKKKVNFISSEHTNVADLLRKIPRIMFQYSGSFCPAEYGYESQFFPSRPNFPKFID